MDAPSGAEESARGRPSYTGESASQLYGAVLLFEEVSRSCGLTEDLVHIFGEQKAAELRTLAYYNILHDDCYNHLESWQRIEWYPSQKVLTPSCITRITQSLSEDDKHSLFALRRRRMTGDAWCGIDSTTYSYYGHALAESRWGHNKEHDRLPQVNQLFMYDISQGMPVYYRRMPGNMPDTRTLRTTLKELEFAGFKDAQLILDRGYLSQEGMELLVKQRISFLLMSKTSARDVKNAICALDADGITLPAHWIPEHGVYGIESTVPFSVTVKGKRREVAPLRLYIFFDPEQQGADRKVLAQHIHETSLGLDAMIEDKTVLDDDSVKKLGEYFDLTLDRKKRILVSYEPNAEAMHSYWALSGYFAMLCSRVKEKDYPLSYVLDRYRMRDEQEKSFMFVKSEQNGRRLRTSTEPSTDGRMLVQFISLTINAAIHRVYTASEPLKKRFPTRKHMVEEMRSIRLIRHPKRAKIITEFVGMQVDIFDAFGFEIPPHCRPSSRPKGKKKS